MAALRVAGDVPPEDPDFGRTKVHRDRAALAILATKLANRLAEPARRGVLKSCAESGEVYYITDELLAELEPVLATSPVSVKRDVLNFLVTRENMQPPEWPLIALEHDRPKAAQAGAEEPFIKQNGADSLATKLIHRILQPEESQAFAFFRDSKDEVYVSLMREGHRETFALRGPHFKKLLQRIAYEEFGVAASSQAVADAIGTLEGHAMNAEVRPVFLRVGEAGGKIYIDLADDSWRVVEIDATGWHVLENSPVHFVRPRAALPLPVPISGGSLAELRGFLNVGDGAWPLVAAWLVAALRPRGPYPLLLLFGAQGSGKSVASRLLRELVDPNAAPLRSPPKEDKDIFIAARHSWMLAFDNLSSVSGPVSDALCRLATGGGFAARALYTDSDEAVLTASRPVLANGIVEVVGRGDLLDRVLLVELETLQERARRTEAMLLADFADARPRIFGGLLDAVAEALHGHGDVQLDELPRMADFALWSIAAEPKLGVSAGAFMESYAMSRESADLVALDSMELTEPLLIAVGDGFQGSAHDLLRRIESLSDPQIRRSRFFPKNARALAGIVRRMAPALKRRGFFVSFSRAHGARKIEISKVLVSMKQENIENFAAPSAPAGASAGAANLSDPGHFAAPEKGFAAPVCIPGAANDANFPYSSFCLKTENGQENTGNLASQQAPNNREGPPRQHGEFCVQQAPQAPDPKEAAEKLEALLRAAPGRSLRLTDLCTAAATLKPPISELEIEAWFPKACEIGRVFEPRPGEVTLV